VLPSPWVTIADIAKHIADGTLAIALGASLERIFIGYFAAVALGMAFGLLATATRAWSVGIPPVFLGMLSVPSVAYVPFAVLWFGPTATAAICVVIIVATIPMALAAVAGAQAVAKRQLQAAQVLGARGMFLVRRVVVPAAMPSLILGVKQTWAYSWRGLLSGELFIRGGYGLGRTMDGAKNHGDVPTMIAVLLIVIVIAQGVDSLVFRTLERRTLQPA
jgi:NitT/TauT family transport system permease protein